MCPTDFRRDLPPGYGTLDHTVTCFEGPAGTWVASLTFPDGLGLWGGLDSFVVIRQPGQPDAIEWLDQEERDGLTQRLVGVASVATAGPPVMLTSRYGANAVGIDEGTNLEVWSLHQGRRQRMAFTTLWWNHADPTPPSPKSSQWNTWERAIHRVARCRGTIAIAGTELVIRRTLWLPIGANPKVVQAHTCQDETRLLLQAP